VTNLEPYTMYTNYFYTNAPTYYGIEDSRLDTIQNQIIGEPDAAKRANLEKQWGQLMVDNVWIIPIAHMQVIWAVGPNVSEWIPMPINQPFTNPEYAKRAK
jgi:ABC-type transport system substrate-binding protein